MKKSQFSTENKTDTQDRIICSTVPDEAEGVRLDLYLAARFTYRSRTAWQQCIRSGEILLNGRKTHASRGLHAGEKIELIFSADTVAEPEVRTDFSIIAQTPDWIAVDKCGDLPVHPSGRYFNNTLQRLLQTQLGYDVFPVNRLDRETSGITLFARSGKAAGLLSALFQEKENGKIRKVYSALVYGDFPDELSAAGFLCDDKDSPVMKKRKFVRELSGTEEDAVTCETHFRCLKKQDGFSLVECVPRTGRLHQIRATLCSLGFPLAGDKMYGPDDNIFIRFIEGNMTGADRDLLRMERQALHARELHFISPFDGTSVSLVCPVPEDFLIR